jgi:hypothetical protein
MELRRPQIHTVTRARRPDGFTLLIILLSCVSTLTLDTACDPRSILMASTLQTETVASSFTLSISPTSLTFDQGTDKSVTVKINSKNGFTENVALSASGLPNGVLAEFSPALAGTESTLNLMANDGAAPGVYEISIQGVAGGLEAKSTVRIAVLPPPRFSLSASPGALTFDQGAGGTTTITVEAQNGFKDNVSLYATGLPKGVFASFIPAALGQEIVLTVTSSDSAIPGHYTVTITGVAGNLQETTSIRVTILPPPGFSLSASPNILNLKSGTSGSTIITVTAISGFSGLVNLSADNLPNGVRIAFSPITTGTVSTVNLSVSDTVIAGTYTIAVVGVAGGHQVTAVLTLTILPPPGFDLLVSPKSLSLASGGNGSVAIAVDEQNGFEGDVSLFATGLPPGVFVTFAPALTATQSILTFVSSGIAAPGVYQLAIRATAGPVQEIKPFPLTILPSANDLYCSNNSPTCVVLPQNWVNNTEYVGTTQNTISFPASGTGGNWSCGATSYGPYTAGSQSSLQQAVNDAEGCRLADGSGTNIIVPAMALFSGATGLVLPQTSEDNSSNFIVLTSTSPLIAGETACSHGIQDNVSASTQPGIRNVGCAGTALSYQLGTTVTAISSGAFTLANGTMTNTSAYDDISSMWTLECTAINCHALSTAVPDANGIAPHNFAILNMEARPQAGLTQPSAIVKIGQGMETAVSQLPQHIHFAYDYIHGDWDDAPVSGGIATGPAVGTNAIPNDVVLDCATCSFMYSYIDKSLRPGAEGHTIYLALSQTLKVGHNWSEGQSIGLFAGGYTESVPIPNFVIQDVEDRANRYTYPYSWILAKQAGFDPAQGSYTRKNAHEFKTGTRILHDGNIDENVDNSGAQGGLVMSWKTDNSSSGTGNNYFIAQNNTTITNGIIRNACNGVSVGSRSASGAGNGGGVALPAQLYFYQNNLMENISTSNPGCSGSTPQYGFRVAGAQNSWSATVLRDPTGSFTTATLISAAGLGQSDFNVGDPVNVSGCSDTSFNTGQDTMGPAALEGTVPTGLTVLYTNPGSAGTGSGVTGCVVTNIQGWADWVAYNHNTDIIGTQGDDPYSPCLGGANPWCLLRNVYFTNSIIVNGGINSVFAEGTRTETKAFDSTTLVFNNDLITGRSAISCPGFSGAACYTEYGGTNNLASPPVTIYLAPTANCLGSTPSSTCVGFSGVMNTGSIPRYLSDWHLWGLCSSATSACSNTASYYSAGQAGQGYDGTSLGISTISIDAAQVSNQYPCCNPSGNGPYPDH